MKKLIATFAFSMMATSLASAQNAEPRYRGQGYLVFGLGTGTGAYLQRPLFKHVGVGGEGFLYRGLGFGAEAGYASWGQYRDEAWIGSADFSYHFGRHARLGGADPFLLGGVSVVGPTNKGGGRGSAAGNFGGGVNLWLSEHAALRFEFRDVVGASFWVYNHYLSFRFGVTFR